MGKITTLLITGKNINSLDGKGIVTKLKEIKRVGGLKKFAVKFQEREFNTRKQADIYLTAVQDVNSPDAYVTDNPNTIKEIQTALKEVYETFLQKGK